MKANIRRGKGFRGLLAYAMDRGDACRIVGGNVSGETVSELSHEFGVGRRVRPDVEKPVWHCSLSLPKGENLPPETWNAIAHALMRKVGLDPKRHQFVVVQHDDTTHEHVHIIASRIGLDGSLWYGVDDVLAAQVATQELEKEFGLTLTKGRSLSSERPGKGLRAGLKIDQEEMNLWTSRNATPPKLYIAEAVNGAIAEGDGTPEDLKRRLLLSGIECRISLGKGKVTGVSYAMQAEWDGGEEAVAYKGSQVGRLYEAKEIERRLAERRSQIDARRQVDLVIAEKALNTIPPGRLAALREEMRDVGRNAGMDAGTVARAGYSDAATTVYAEKGQGGSPGRDDRRDAFRRPGATESSAPIGRPGRPGKPRGADPEPSDRRREGDSGTPRGSGVDERADPGAGKVDSSKIVRGTEPFLPGGESTPRGVGAIAPGAGLMSVGGDDVWKNGRDESEGGRSAFFGEGSESSGSGSSGIGADHRPPGGNPDVSRRDPEADRGDDSRQGSGFERESVSSGRADPWASDDARNDAQGRGSPGDFGDDEESIIGDLVSKDPDAFDAVVSDASDPRLGDGDIRSDSFFGHLRSGVMAWNSRFKQASAARKRAQNGVGEAVSGSDSARETGDGRRFGGGTFGDEIVRQARLMSPLAFLKRHYSDVYTNPHGTHIEIEGELRADQASEGEPWLACTWTSEGIGDNIDLVSWVLHRTRKPLGQRFIDCVRELIGLRHEPAEPQRKVSEKSRYPTIPYELRQHVEAGYRYLEEERGISRETIDHAKASRFLRFCDNGVIYLGYEGDRIRCANVRRIRPDANESSKREITSSSKLFPAILPGDPAHVVIVEGGTDGLAAQDLARRHGDVVPTVISTSGVGVRKWLSQNEKARRIVEDADRVTIFGQRERGDDGRSDPEKQEKTDELRQKLAETVALFRVGEVPEILYPPKPFKDAAEWNHHEFYGDAKKFTG